MKEIGSLKAKILIAEKSGCSHIHLLEENAKEAKEVKELKRLNVEIIEVASVDCSVMGEDK